MLFITGHDAVRFRRQRTFQYHFVIRIAGGAGGAVSGKNQFSGFSQGSHPLDRLDPGIIQAKFLNGLVVFRQQ